MALVLGLCLAGCADQDGTAEDGPGMAGNWTVTAVDDQPIPEGSSITLKYGQDGQLVVEELGNLNSIPLFNRDKLKESMDRLNRSGPQPTTTRMIVEDKEVDLTRRAAETEDDGS